MQFDLIIVEDATTKRECVVLHFVSSCVCVGSNSSTRLGGIIVNVGVPLVTGEIMSLADDTSK